MKISRPGFPMIDTDAPALAATKQAEPRREEDNAPRDENGLRTDGPALEGFVAAGYSAENYPPSGYAEKNSPGLEAFKKSQATASAAGSSTSPPADAVPAAAAGQSIAAEAADLAARLAAEGK